MEKPLIRELRQTLRLALPMIFGHLGGMAMGWIDVAMVGHGVGSVALAGLAFGVNIAHVAFCGGIGLMAALSVLVARAYGARDAPKCRAILRTGLFVSVLFSLGMALLLTWGIDVLDHMGQEQEVAEIAKPYLVIYGWGFVFLLSFASLRAFCEAQNRPWTPYLVLCSGIALNIFLNWVLIFGNLGAPRLEVRGAAIATVCAHLFCLVVLGSLVLTTRRYGVEGSGWSVLQLHRVTRREVADVLQLGVPTSLQVILEVGTFTLAAVMMGWVGARQLAAHQIALSMAAMSFMVPLGFSIAVAIRVGQESGAGAAHAIRRIGVSSIGFALAFMSCTAVAFILGRNVFPLIFTTDPEVTAYAAQFLIIVGVFQVFDGLQATNLGILRGLKDVRVPLGILFIGYWGLCIPLGYYLTFLRNWGGIGIWIGLATGLCVVSLILSARFLHVTRLRQHQPPG